MEATDLGLRLSENEQSSKHPRMNTVENDAICGLLINEFKNLTLEKKLLLIEEEKLKRTSSLAANTTRAWALATDVKAHTNTMTANLKMEETIRFNIDPMSKKEIKKKKEKKRSNDEYNKN